MYRPALSRNAFPFAPQNRLPGRRLIDGGKVRREVHGVGFGTNTISERRIGMKENGLSRMSEMKI